MPDPAPYLAGFGESSPSLSSWVFEELSRRIVEGVLTPGEKVTEEALVKELGASRTPLREAIRQLEELGLIVRQRNRTLRFAPLLTAELMELVRLREHIEGLAAAEAAIGFAEGRVDTRPIWQIIRLIEDAEQNREGVERIDQIFDLGTAFHNAILKASGMKRVMRIHGGLQLALARYRLVNARDQRRLNHRSVEHRRILEAVETGDPDAAEKEMRNHIREALKAYQSNKLAEMDAAAVLTLSRGQLTTED